MIPDTKMGNHGDVARAIKRCPISTESGVVQPKTRSNSGLFASAHAVLD